MYRVQYISQGNTPEEHLENIGQVLRAGGQWIQLRLKNLDGPTYIQYALEAKRLCDAYQVPLIINDNAFVASQCDAYGLHLGLTDMSVSEARKILGPGKIIGGSANTLEDVQQRQQEGVDYIGLGPYRHTSTKEKLSPILGIEGYQRILENMKEMDISIPVFAIGGILPDDAPGLRKAGVYGVAVSGVLSTALNKKENLSEFLKGLNPEQ